ncbi:MAG: cell division protein FtsL [Myxococcaceae bacterium]|nr:cell division protein FtsL [Myxococcaceae bacterium]MBH2006041.1 cell division protein FtsL [Myxococcaceae bacterium]
MNPILFAEAVSEIKSNPRLSVIHNSNFTRHYYRPIRKSIFPALCVGALMGSLLFLVFVQVGNYIEGYSMALLEKEQDQILAELQALKLEESVLKRPERIQHFALKSLHLIPPSQAPKVILP